MFKKYERSGPDVNGWKTKQEDKVNGCLTNKVFLKKCEELGVTPTRRQASRYVKKRGIIYTGGRA